MHSRAMARSGQIDYVAAENRLNNSIWKWSAVVVWGQNRTAECVWEWQKSFLIPCSSVRCFSPYGNNLIVVLTSMLTMNDHRSFIDFNTLISAYLANVVQRCEKIQDFYFTSSAFNIHKQWAGEKLMGSKRELRPCGSLNSRWIENSILYSNIQARFYCFKY